MRINEQAKQENNQLRWHSISHNHNDQNQPILPSSTHLTLPTPTNTVKSIHPSPRQSRGPIIINLILKSPANKRHAIPDLPTSPRHNSPSTIHHNLINAIIQVIRTGHEAVRRAVVVGPLAVACARCVGGLEVSGAEAGIHGCAVGATETDVALGVCVDDLVARDGG